MCIKLSIEHSTMCDSGINLNYMSLHIENDCILHELQGMFSSMILFCDIKTNSSNSLEQTLVAFCSASGGKALCTLDRSAHMVPSQSLAFPLHFLSRPLSLKEGP